MAFWRARLISNKCTSLTAIFFMCVIFVTWMSQRSYSTVKSDVVVVKDDRLSKGASPPKSGSSMAPYVKKALQNRKSPNDEWFKDSMMWGQRRKDPVYLTIGIPCLVRPRGDRYIVKTLNLLIRHSTEEQRNQMTIVVFMADQDTNKRDKEGSFLYQKYKAFVDGGFIQIIKAPSSFYPDLGSVKKYTSDPLAKVKWHSKQNFDFSYMMLYSQSLGDYYLQLEDDVVTVPGYMNKIQEFINRQKNDWVCLEFCTLGFIAKLYHSYHLEKLAQMLMLFYNEHPNDVTYLDFNRLMFQSKKIALRPSIFDHIGVHSSLPLKMNSLRDTTFKANPKDIEDNDPDIRGNVVNNHYPPAKLSCTVKTYDQYTPQKFYSGEEDVYFAMVPKAGDAYTIVFDTPQKLLNVSVVSGHKNYPDDYIHEGVLQVGKKGDTSDLHKLGCSDIVQTAIFENGHASIHNIAREPEIACVQISFSKTQNNWLLITQFALTFHTG